MILHVFKKEAHLLENTAREVLLAKSLREKKEIIDNGTNA